MNYSPQYKCFRALLLEIRTEAGLSQAALAQLLGKSQTLISKVEIGERRMDFIETAEFCAACNVTIAEFSTRFQAARDAGD
jgi:transcriptional regulator with XRE-family HTH domain